MKYIRTKDGTIYQVYDKVFEYKGDKRYQLADSRFEISLNDIVKQADTIEKLIDTFVVKYAGDYLPCNIGLRLPKRSWKRFWEENRPEFIYGAIWTDKGLIYVTKMNDEGELELL